MTWGGLLGSEPQSFGTTYVSNEFDRRKVSVGIAGVVLSFFPLGKIFGQLTLIPLIRKFGRRTVTLWTSSLCGVSFIATALSKEMADDSQFSALHCFLRFLHGACSSWTMASIMSLALYNNPAHDKHVI